MSNSLRSLLYQNTISELDTRVFSLTMLLKISNNIYCDACSVLTLISENDWKAEKFDIIRDIECSVLKASD